MVEAATAAIEEIHLDAVGAAPAARAALEAIEPMVRRRRLLVLKQGRAKWQEGYEAGLREGNDR